MTEALTTTQQALMEVPEDLVADAGRGTERIAPEDIRPPKLMLCQSGTPQRQPDNIMALGHNHVEFDKDLKVVERDIPDGDWRTIWGGSPDGTPRLNEKGKLAKPWATKFLNYLVWLPQHQEMLTLSFKSTQLKHAVSMNGIMTSKLKFGEKVLVNPPAWARTYALETRMEQDGTYAWCGFNLNPLGITPPEVRVICRGLAAKHEKSQIVIDVEEGEAPETTSVDQSTPPVDDAPPPVDDDAPPF
jgi:hypothetical protein